MPADGSCWTTGLISIINLLVFESPAKLRSTWSLRAEKNSPEEVNPLPDLKETISEWPRILRRTCPGSLHTFFMTMLPRLRTGS